SGRSLLVTNINGLVAGGGLQGFYFENTRLLCRESLTVGGDAPTIFAASPVGGDALLADATLPHGPAGPEPAFFATIARFVGDGLRTSLRLDNYARCESAQGELVIRLEADFADLEEAQAGLRRQTGEVERIWDAARQELLLRYRHPGLDRAVAVRVEGAPAREVDGALILAFDVQPHGSVAFDLALEPIFDGRRHAAPPARFDRPEEGLEAVRARLRAEIPRLVASNPTVVRAWETATRDLASLPLGDPHGPATPIAGLPSYQQFFGRDTLTIGWQAALALPTILRDSLLANAPWQGAAIDDWTDEQPGKLIHQARRGPLSVLGLEPFRHYYGDYATPPDFLIMLGQYLGWSGDLATVRQLLPTARRAIAWLADEGDLDGDGFIEYVTRSPDGLKNQGWKDSGDAIVDERGEIVANPIATCELQAWWYAGLQQAALVFLAAGEPLFAFELFAKARALAERFDRAFWLDDLGFYALGLDSAKRPIRTVASNPGHLLAAGIVPRGKGRRVVRRLLEPDLFSGWGVRTLSSAHPRYNPFSYHLGSVWPVENAAFAFGFARYGCWDELHALAAALFAASDLFVGNRLPEALGGLPRDAAHPHPGIYPHANAPQGWSASAVVLLIQALLGVRAVAPLRVLLVDPHLPPWLPALRLEGVQVGQSRLDLTFRRTQTGKTRYRVERCAGDVRVLRQPAPQAPSATLGGRLRAAATSVWHA
ncbi:MAG TPA: glycogen debranching N-terminal domain-containing protein, partial [Thermomicrobiales bacterium]|nr:glycogen debranching N-terminal domain-containing protein [Thermomicrobiales bacterium]